MSSAGPPKTAIAKADVLIEAMEWIRKFRDKVTVIKLGGSVMEDENALRHLLVAVSSLKERRCAESPPLSEPRT